jgi:site-specific DNA-cytosine methylase
MKILVACEESQRVCIAFRQLEHEAYSCDILPCSGGHPEWHIKEDVLKHLNDGWDMMIAFPPCTHLSYAGVRWFPTKQKEQKEAIDFFLKLANAPIKKICIENPLGIMSKIYRKHDQVINPFQFGHRERKRTCLWLKNLSLLHYTNLVPPEEPVAIDSTTGHKRYFTDGTHRKGIERSKTFQGIAGCNGRTMVKSCI